MPNSILVVDDDREFLEKSLRLLPKHFPDALILQAETTAHAKHILQEHNIHVVLTDMIIESPEAGFDLLRHIKRTNPRTQVIVVTVAPDFDNAVRCMYAGCFYYFPKDTLYDKKQGDFFIYTLRRAIELSQSNISREPLTERLILSEWDRLCRSTNTAKDKGVVLESLCALLFRTVSGWTSLRERHRSKNEEFDIVVRNETNDTFWQKFGVVILVECKNWATRPDRKEFDAFEAKIRRRGPRNCRLGFFVSLSGVTSGFADAARHAISKSIIIVTINQSDIWELICADDRNEHLKRLVEHQLVS